MGAWGEGILENDAALDILCLWDEWVEKRSLSVEEATERAFKHWGASLSYADAITNSEVMALAAMFLEKELTLPKRLSRAAVDAVNRELFLGELNRWGDPQARERDLMTLLKALGGEVKPPKTKRLFRHKAIHYRDSKAAIRSLSRLRKNKYSFSSSRLPPFIRSLNRLMFSHVREENQNITIQAMAERHMMLLWYLSHALRLSDEEFTELMESIEKNYR